MPVSTGLAQGTVRWYRVLRVPCLLALLLALPLGEKVGAKPARQKLLRAHQAPVAAHI
jgi:hypothetical protein